jgi:hypothetical protein
MATTAKKVSVKKEKRLRRDTFWHYTDEQNGAYFGDIYDGKSEAYYIGLGDTKEDSKGRTKYCWRVYSKDTNNPADSLRSTKAYRLSLVWSTYTKPSFWKHPKKAEAVKQSLPRIKTKQGDHSRHLCGNGWCCNPRHLAIGSRTSNEVDKHYHYFLNHEDKSVRERFLKAFPDLMSSQGVW